MVNSSSEKKVVLQRNTSFESGRDKQAEKPRVVLILVLLLLLWRRRRDLGGQGRSDEDKLRRGSGRRALGAVGAVDGRNDARDDRRLRLGPVRGVVARTVTGSTLRRVSLLPAFPLLVTARSRCAGLSLARHWSLVVVVLAVVVVPAVNLLLVAVVVAPAGSVLVPVVVAVEVPVREAVHLLLVAFLTPQAVERLPQLAVPVAERVQVRESVCGRISDIFPLFLAFCCHNNECLFKRYNSEIISKKGVHFAILKR